MKAREAAASVVLEAVVQIWLAAAFSLYVIGKARHRPKDVFWRVVRDGAVSESEVISWKKKKRQLHYIDL